MDEGENLREDPVRRIGVESDRDDEHDRQNRCRDPLFARGPGNATQLKPHPANEFAWVRPVTRWSRRCFTTHCDLSGNWQGGQDSNLQPTVLETATLPIELPPYGPLLRLAVRLMAAAKAAVLAQLEPFRRFLLIFLRVVIAAFAFRTRHNDHHAILFFCHFYKPQNQEPTLNKRTRRSVQGPIIASAEGVRQASRGGRAPGRN